MRLTQIWAPSNENIIFAYDAGGRMQTMCYSNGALASYTYNALGNRNKPVEKVGSTDLAVPTTTSTTNCAA